jgi:uncharacterized membrane protein
MAVRLHEVHPAIVHFPLAFLPLAIGADLLGRLTGSKALRETGRRMMPLAAVSAAVSAATGLVAQEEVEAEGRARDVLVTHRNLNLGMVGAASALAAWRWRRREPSASYLALGLAGLGAVTYSAYLGSKMVYEYGVGVDAAQGMRPGRGAELVPGQLGAVARDAVRDVERAIPHAVDDLRRGDIVPAAHGDGDWAGRGQLDGPDGRGRFEADDRDDAF